MLCSSCLSLTPLSEILRANISRDFSQRTRDPAVCEIHITSGIARKICVLEVAVGHLTPGLHVHVALFFTGKNGQRCRSCCIGTINFIYSWNGKKADPIGNFPSTLFILSTNPNWFRHKKVTTMPPSIPPHGGVNSPSNGVATRLPLIRETNKNPKGFNKLSSRSATKQLHRLPSGTQRADSSRSRSNLLRNSRMKNRSLAQRNKSEQTSPPSSRQRTITNVENDSENNSSNNNSSLNSAQTTSTAPLDTAGLAPYGGISTVSPYGFYGGAASMMSPSPFMGMGMNTMGLPYLSGLNQIVFNIQNIIFSISQAIHVIGANQQALQHAWESLNQMVDHAVATFHEMRALETIQRESESEEERNKRKKLKALRYAFVFGGSWLAYKLIRNLLFRKRSLKHQQSRTLNGQANPGSFSPSSLGTPNMTNYPNNMYGTANMGYPGYSSYYSGLGSNGYYWLDTILWLDIKNIFGNDHLILLSIVHRKALIPELQSSSKRLPMQWSCGRMIDQDLQEALNRYGSHWFSKNHCFVITIGSLS